MTSPQRSVDGDADSAVLVYDADCGFCTASALWLAKGREDRLSAQAWQSLSDLGAHDLSLEMVQRAAYWLVNGKPAAAGARAIAAALKARGGAIALVGHVIDAPVVRPIAAAVYRLVADNRHRMPGGTAACRLPGK